MHFLKLPCPLHEEHPKNLPNKICLPIFHGIFFKKVPSILYGMRHNPLAPLENHVWVYFPSVQKSELKRFSILTEMRIVWQNMSVSWVIYIRIGMLSVKTPIWVFWQDLTSLWSSFLPFVKTEIKKQWLILND